jgi:hypothetical protein
VDDETAAIRQIVARSFSLLAASVHAKDPEHQVEIAIGYERWIMTGEYPAPIFDEASAAMLRGICDIARTSRNAKR